MNVSLYFSGAAVLISLLSLCWAIHIGNRDRGKLLAQSKIYKQSNFYETMPDVLYIKLKAVNCGRRSIILTMLWRHYDDKAVVGSVLGAIRLGENEQFERDLQDNDIVNVDDDGNVRNLINLFFEDTLGSSYPVKNARKHLKQISEQNQTASKPKAQ